ncbi:MAG: translation elongation factor Ts [Candidatus Buchananbacteria bacterium]
MDKNLVVKLREQTGAGMSDCLKALQESQGDLVLAAEILRKKGITKAAKRSERETKEGLIKVLVTDQGKTGYLAEFNAETDFVVRSEKFQQFAEQAFELLVAQKLDNRDELLQTKLLNNTVAETLDSLSGIIGEKLEIKRVAKLTAKGLVAAYTHNNNKVGVLVALDWSGDLVDQTAVDYLAKEIAMQVAALNPAYLVPAEVPAEIVAKEKEIYQEELKQQNKPENIWPKIIEGKLQKLYAEVCLLKQPNIREEEKTVEQIIAELSKKLGVEITVASFIRFKI